MAAAIYTHWRWPAKARVTLSGDGTALVETGTHELGTGTYTVLRQVAADALGLPPEMVTMRLGDTRPPASHASIGSATMANAGASVMLAAKAVRDKAMALAGNNPNIGHAELLAQSGVATLSADADYDPVPESDGPKAVFSFAAVFAEVRVDPELGLVRLNRSCPAAWQGQRAFSGPVKSWSGKLRLCVRR